MNKVSNFISRKTQEGKILNNLLREYAPRGKSYNYIRFGVCIIALIFAILALIVMLRPDLFTSSGNQLSLALLYFLGAIILWLWTVAIDSIRYEEALKNIYLKTQNKELEVKEEYD